MVQRGGSVQQPHLACLRCDSPHAPSGRALTASTDRVPLHHHREARNVSSTSRTWRSVGERSWRSMGCEQAECAAGSADGRRTAIPRRTRKSRRCSAETAAASTVSVTIAPKAEQEVASLLSVPYCGPCTRTTTCSLSACLPAFLCLLRARPSPYQHIAARPSERSTARTLPYQNMHSAPSGDHLSAPC